MTQNRHTLFNLLRFFFSKYRKGVLIGILAIILVDLTELALPILLKRIVDALQEGRALELIPSTLIGVGIIVFLQVICRYLWRVSLSRSAMSAGADLRETFSEQIFCVPVALYDKRKVGDLMTLATSDVENIRLALGPGLISLVDSLFYCITLPIAMFYLAPDLAFKMLIPVIGIPFAVVLLQSKIADFSAKVQRKIALLGVYTQETVAGVRLAKIYGVEPRLEKRLNHHSHALNEGQVSLGKIQAIFAPTLEFFLSCSLVILFGFGSAFSIGTLVAMQRYLQKLMWPMSAVGMAIIYFQKAKASGVEFDRFLDEERVETVSESIEFAQLPNPQATVPLVEAKNLTFSYDGETPVIQNLSFQLFPGEWIGIEGPVGTGKSTLLYLLMKFYEIPRGQLFVFGKDVVDWKPQEIRRLFSTVLQEPYLFQGSVRYNLDVGNEFGIGVETALQHAGIAEASGSGSALSGGQKQRVAIARALRKDALVFLFDDPLSSVDLKTSENVLKNISLELRQRKKTIIFVSHHPEHLAFCDRLIRLGDSC